MFLFVILFIVSYYFLILNFPFFFSDIILNICSLVFPFIEAFQESFCISCAALFAIFVLFNN
mgnify:CR=1 FL=1